MKKISFFWSLLLLGAMACGPVAAEPADSAATPTPSAKTKFSIGAVVDSYYSYDFTNALSQPPQYGNTGYFAPSERAYSLSLAEFALIVRQGDGSAHLSMIYGETADSIARSRYPLFIMITPGLFYVWEAYGDYHPGDLTLRFGKFASYLGLEKIESNEDWNYSRSLIFTFNNMPRYHMGLSAAYDSPDKLWGVTGYVCNGYNGLDLPIYQGRMYGLKVEAKPQEGLDLVLNGLTGPFIWASNSIFANSFGEFIATWKVTPELSVALDALANQITPDDVMQPSTMTFWGAALYGRYQIDSDWAVAARIEETENIVAAWNSPDILIWPSTLETHSEAREATITVERHLTEHVLARLEARYDYVLFNGQTFAPGNGSYAGGSNDQYTGTAGLVVSF